MHIRVFFVDGSQRSEHMIIAYYLHVLWSSAGDWRRYFGIGEVIEPPYSPHSGASLIGRSVLVKYLWLRLPELNKIELFQLSLPELMFKK